MIFVGGILHLAVVALPMFLIGGSLRDPATLAFIAGVSALYFGDAVTMRWPPTPSSSTLDARARRWAALMGGMILIFFWACLVERAALQPVPSWLQFVGAALMFAGIALRAIAVRTLGPSFRTEIERVDGNLVLTGAYGFVRHPSESGLLAATLGAAVLLRSEVGVVAWCAVLVPLTLARLSLEERALEERFGRRYLVYAGEVGALLPRVRLRT